MQAEAGQPLQDIVFRKELEREAGHGLFFWGIGNPLGENLSRLVARAREPIVLFSLMRSRPKRLDSKPDAILLWTAYRETGGAVRPLPKHALVLSRASTERGIKRRHYALVCRSGESLRLEHYGALDATHFRNLGSTAPRVGASQVTAVVEHVSRQPAKSLAEDPNSTSQQHAKGIQYAVNMRARLVAPFFVSLARPRVLSTTARTCIESLANTFTMLSSWHEVVATVHEHSSDLTEREESLGLDGLVDDDS